MDDSGKIRDNLSGLTKVERETLELQARVGQMPRLIDTRGRSVSKAIDVDAPRPVTEVLTFRVRVNGVVITSDHPFTHYVKINKRTGELIESRFIRLARELATRDIIDQVDLSRLLEEEGKTAAEKYREAAGFNINDYAKALRSRLKMDGLVTSNIQISSNLRIQTYPNPLRNDIQNMENIIKRDGINPADIYGAPNRAVDGIPDPLMVSRDLRATGYYGRNPITGNLSLYLPAGAAGSKVMDTDGDAGKPIIISMQNKLSGKFVQRHLTQNYPQTSDPLYGDVLPLEQMNWAERYPLATTKAEVLRNMKSMKSTLDKAYAFGQARNVVNNLDVFEDLLNGLLVDPQIGLITDALVSERVAKIRNNGWDSPHLDGWDYRLLEYGGLKSASKGVKGLNVNIDNVVDPVFANRPKPVLTAINKSLLLGKPIIGEDGQLLAHYPELITRFRFLQKLSPNELTKHLRGYQTGEIIERLAEQDLFETTETGEIVERPLRINPKFKRRVQSDLRIDNPLTNPILNKKSVLHRSKIDVAKFRRKDLVDMPAPVLLERRDFMGNIRNFISAPDNRGVARALVVVPEYRVNMEKNTGRWINPEEIIKEVAQKVWNTGDYKKIYHPPIGNSNYRLFGEESADFSYNRIFQLQKGNLTIKEGAGPALDDFVKNLQTTREDLLSMLSKRSISERENVFKTLIVQHDLIKAQKNDGFATAFIDAIRPYSREVNAKYIENDFGRLVAHLTDQTLKILSRDFTVSSDQFSELTPRTAKVLAKKVMAQIGALPNSSAYKDLTLGIFKGHITAGVNTLGIDEDQGLGRHAKRYAKNVKPLRNGVTWSGESAILFNNNELEELVRYINGDVGIGSPNENTAFITREGFELHSQAFLNSSHRTPYNSAVPTDVHTETYEAVNPVTGNKEIRYTFHPDKIKEIFSGGVKVVVAGEKVSPVGLESVNAGDTKMAFVHMLDQVGSRGDILDKLNQAADYYGLPKYPGQGTEKAQLKWLETLSNKAEDMDVYFQKEGEGLLTKAKGLRIGVQEFASSTDIVDILEGQGDEMVASSGAKFTVAQSLAHYTNQIQEEIGLDTSIRVDGRRLLSNFVPKQNPISAEAQFRAALENMNEITNAARGKSIEAVEIAGRLAGGIIKTFT